MKNHNFFTPELVLATLSSRLCHHCQIIVKRLFSQTWVEGFKYEGGEETFPQLSPVFAIN